MREADVVVGYGPYVDQCADLLRPARRSCAGAMGEEAARARRGGRARARGRARRARVLAATPACTAWPRGRSRASRCRRRRPAVEVVPGVTAALAAAARLGAPLADDWATLSLSDLHVPWATVERRLTALAAVGLALALYNPRSATRTEPFDRALAILREHRAGGHAGRRSPPTSPATARRSSATTLADARPGDA